MTTITEIEHDDDTPWGRERREAAERAEAMAYERGTERLVNLARPVPDTSAWRRDAEAQRDDQVYGVGPFPWEREVEQ